MPTAFTGLRDKIIFLISVFIKWLGEKRIDVYIRKESEAVVRRYSVEKVFLEISQNLQENTCARVSFLIKLRALVLACNFIKKEIVTQMFSCEFCEISKKIFFYRTHAVAASEEFMSLFT